MKEKNNPLELNQVRIPILAFMEFYNKTIPISFPHASVKILKHFQILNPVLFKHTKEWSIDKHRKKVMDWLSSYSNKAE